MTCPASAFDADVPFDRDGAESLDGLEDKNGTGSGDW